MLSIIILKLLATNQSKYSALFFSPLVTLLYTSNKYSTSLANAIFLLSVLARLSYIIEANSSSVLYPSSSSILSLPSSFSLSNAVPCFTFHSYPMNSFTLSDIALGTLLNGFLRTVAAFLFMFSIGSHLCAPSISATSNLLIIGSIYDLALATAFLFMLTVVTRGVVFSTVSTLTELSTLLSSLAMSS